MLAALIALTLTLVAGNSPLLGLDLQGGVSVVLQPKEQVESDALDQTIDIIRQRVDALGVAEPEITRQGDTVLVQIPGVEDRDRAIELVGQTAELRFRPVLGEYPPGAVQVETPTDTTPTDSVPTGDGTTDTSVEGSTDSSVTTDSSEQGLGAAEGEVALGRQPTDTVTDGGTPDTAPATDPAPATTDTSAVDATTVQPQQTTSIPSLPDDVCTAGVPPEDDQPDQQVTLPLCDPETNELLAIYSLGPTLLSGDSLETARANLTQQGEWVVSPTFKGGEGGIDKFNTAAGQCFNQAATCPTGRLAIVLDSRVVSAPNIQQASFERATASRSAATSTRARRVTWPPCSSTALCRSSSSASRCRSCRPPSARTPSMPGSGRASSVSSWWPPT